jgi:O-antigen ligase
LDFCSLLVLNAVLYVRPAEFIPALIVFPLYQIALALSIAFSLRPLLGQLSLRSLGACPISVCIVGVVTVAVFGHLVRFAPSSALEAADMALKVLLYYFLLAGVANTPSRLRGFIASSVLCAVVISGVAVLDYHGVVKVPNLALVMDTAYVAGEAVEFRRLGSTGLFGDPNDMCLLLNFNIIFGLYLVADPRRGLMARAFWLAPMPLLMHALYLTHSRGGLLSLAAGLGVFLVDRYGRKAVVLGAVAFPVLLAAFAGRQTDFSVSGGTGQQRVQLWSDYLFQFRTHPVLGIGYLKSIDHNPLLAHNSYISAYTELGFAGGTLFLGAFCVALLTLVRHSPRHNGLVDPELKRLRPYLLASLSSYMVGILSLSRTFAIPTYTILGLVAAFQQCAATGPSPIALRFTLRLALQLTVVSVLFLILIHLFVMRNVSYG